MGPGFTSATDRLCFSELLLPEPTTVQSKKRDLPTRVSLALQPPDVEDGEGVKLLDGVPMAVIEGDGVGVKDADGERVGEKDTVGDAEPVAPSDMELEGVLVIVGVGDCVGVADGDAESDGVLDGDGVADGGATNHSYV